MAYRTVEVSDVKGKFWYHGRVQDIKNVDGKNLNVTRHLLEDKKDGTVLVVDLDKITFKDEPIIRGKK